MSTKILSKLKVIIYVLTIIFLLPTIFFWLLYLIPGGYFRGPFTSVQMFYLSFISFLASFSFIIFSDSKTLFISYLVITSILLLTSFGLIFYQNRQRSFSRPIFYLFLVGLLAFIYMFGFKLRYQPALMPKEGVNFQVVAPTSGFNRMYRSILASGERSDNKLEILGWLDNDTLIYKKWSRDEGNHISGEGTVLQYNFISKTSNIFDESITNLSNKRCKYRECISEFADSFADDQAVGKDAWVSPDGKRFAYLSRYIYGPEDIMIFEK